MQQEHDREHFVPLARTFHALTATGDEEDPWSGLSSLGGTTWADLLAKPRVLLLSEAGSGKTREVESAANELRAAGKTAFFLRLEFIKDALENAFEVGSYEEFQAWLASPSEEAWLFLDSIDEAKLGSPLDFQLAKSLLVSKDELVEILQRDLPGLTVAEVARRLQVPPVTIQKLHGMGVLPKPSVPNPSGLRPAFLTAIDEVDDFEKTYISLGSISKRLGIHHVTVQHALEAEGLRPAFDRSSKSIIYFTADVGRVYPQVH